MGMVVFHFEAPAITKGCADPSLVPVRFQRKTEQIVLD